MTPIDWSLLVLSSGLLVVSLRPKLQNSLTWRAVVTPLASIVGSGFLVIAPLLGKTVGGNAALAMLVIVVAAYAIGTILRFNIRHAEPLIDSANSTDTILLIERGSNILLSVAYVISVTFYIRLLSAFVFRNFSIESDLAANALTSSILAFIGFVGWHHGLRGLERLEKYSVTVKLCIIAALLAGLAYFDTIHGFEPSGLVASTSSLWDTARTLGGMLLVVQGFETSRYQGADYSAELRVRGMRTAQLVAAGIYLTFVILIAPLLHWLQVGATDETSIIDLAGKAAIVLPSMLIVAAIMSQFSAAVADTVGAGGLLAEESAQKLSSRLGYLLVAVLAIVLVWTFDIFEIIALASRAFAAYYLVQSLVALVATRRLQLGNGWAYQLMFGIMAVGLSWIVVFGKSVG
jgi:hypothetical protein